MIETHRLKKVVIFIQTILSFMLSRKMIHYCLQMYLKTLEINVLKYMNLKSSTPEMSCKRFYHF